VLKTNRAPALNQTLKVSIESIERSDRLSPPLTKTFMPLDRGNASERFSDITAFPRDSRLAIYSVLPSVSAGSQIFIDMN
jgi:hypothetical protein